MSNACRLPAIRHNDGFKPNNLLRLSEEARCDEGSAWHAERKKASGRGVHENVCGKSERDYARIYGGLEFTLDSKS